MTGPVVRVVETFSSLQGEGAWAGWPCFFIRLSGCNLRCSYCDTTYAYEGGRVRSVADLVREWRQSGLPVVEVTGGEPLLQPHTSSLLDALVAAGGTVLLETNGSVSLGSVPPGVVKIVDRKTPGSGAALSWDETNLRWLSQGDQVKFVLVDRTDYEWARTELARLRLSSYLQVLFSPVTATLAPVDLARWILEDRLKVRFQLQLHKVLWGDRRGV